MAVIFIPGLTPLAIGGTPTTSGTAGSPITPFTVDANGGVAPRQFSLIGRWPPGASVGATSGVVTPGTPTEAGSFDGLSVRVTDALGSTADLAVFDLTVSAASGFTCNAVAFDGTTNLDNSSFVATNNSLGLFSLWVNNQNTDVDPGIQWTTVTNGYWFVTVFQGNINNSIQVQLWDAATNTKQFAFASATDAIDGVGWHNILIGADTNHAAGLKIGKITLDGTPLSVTILSDSDDAFDVGWSVPGEDITTSNNNPKCYGAEWWLGCGQYADVSDSAVIAKFIDAGGKPVDLGADGSTPTGTAPAIYLSQAAGDNTASHFATNKGTGGDFTITGALTIAPSSPSD